MKKVMREVFETEDGTLFLTEKEARDYERALELTQYFRVNYEPDLNETGKLTKTGFLEVYANRSHELWAEQWCFDEFGSTVAFIQGTAPTVNWNIRKTDRASVDFANILHRIKK